MPTDSEYTALPAHVRVAVDNWIEALQAADSRAEGVLELATAEGVSKADIRALARWRLAEISPRRPNHLAIGF